MKNDKSYINLNNVFEKINVVPGDKLLVSSNILKILIKLKKKDKEFNANLIIDLLLNKKGVWRKTHHELFKTKKARMEKFHC